MASHLASTTSSCGASIDPRRWHDRYAVVTGCTCTSNQCVWCRYVTGTGGAITSIVPSNSSIKHFLSTTFSSRIVAGHYSSGYGRRYTELHDAVLWAGRRKNFTSGRLAPSSSSLNTCSSTVGSSRISVGGDGREKAGALLKCSVPSCGRGVGKFHEWPFRSL